MKIIIIVFLLFNLINLIKTLDPPRCLYGTIYKLFDLKLEPTMVGNVDWWIYEHFYGGGAVYTDSNLKTKEKKILEFDSYNMRESKKNSPIIDTFNQIVNDKFSSFAYNDGYVHNTASNDPKGSAHEKGFFIWNEAGGIHVIHSIPETPQKNDHFFLDSSKDLYLQHSICLTLKPEELDIIPKFLIYTNPKISLINTLMLSKSTSLSKIKKDSIENINTVDKTLTLIPNIATIKKFTDMDKIIEDNIFATSKLPKVIKIFQWAQLAGHISGNYNFTSDSLYDSMHYYKMKSHWLGDYFVQTSIASINSKVDGEKTSFVTNNMNSIEILWQYIGKQYNSISTFSNWISQTMTSSKGFPQIGNTYSITLKLNYPHISKPNERSASKDHSKLMYGISDDKSLKIMCLGGLNWQLVQDSRGGGAFCSKEIGYLVDYLKRHVSWTRMGISKLPATSPLSAKRGVPHSTVGTLVDFSWIKDQLAKEGLTEPMAFEILVPNSPHPFSKRAVIPSVFQFKTSLAQILIEKSSSVPLSYKTEEISIDIFPSVETFVNLCKDANCSFESTIKSNIVTNLKLSVVIPDIAKTEMYLEKDPKKDVNLKITVTPITKSYYFSSQIAKQALKKYGLNLKYEKVFLQETTKSDKDFTFKFPLTPNTLCPNKTLDTGKISFEFHPFCIDQLAFCLHRQFQMDIDKDLNLDTLPTQTNLYNKITNLLKNLIPTIPNNINRCIPEIPVLPNIIDSKMEDNSKMDIET
ncbi:hypothetical protein RB653_009597 [Dictyostelium firmibasis]|uniref:Uncharacterized protein n=1 Tax=Dictyostelium firmibasis TaxID=79012 RepID=A0AAN7U1Z6_9MYCE